MNAEAQRSNENVWFKTRKGGVTASKGVVATNHPLASAAGVEALAHGGNAFDAAVASLFALTVVEPMMVGIFGAGFFVIRDGESGEITTLDNYAVAPKAATNSMYQMVEKRKPGQNIFATVGRKNEVGRLAVATPGTLKAWEHIVDTYGKLSLGEAIRPAIKLAREGFKASPFLSYVVELISSDLGLFEASAETFLPGGKPLKPGQRVLMPDYAETLEKIAEKGSDFLYRGELGRAIADDMEENGGLITMDDLASYSLIDRDPVKGVYRDDYEIYAMAPGSSGGTHIIQMLNILEASDVASLGFGSVGHLHLMAEVLKITFADRQRYMGDPSLVDIPMDGLISKEYAANRAQEITGDAQTYSPGDPLAYVKAGGETTHLSTMDSEGNMVAATQTLNNAFGSKVTVPGTGVLLNNCMTLFDPRPGRANSVAGRKRMLSSMSPTILLRRGEPFLAIGTPGGLRIFPSVCQAIVNIVDFGMTLQEAVEAPRIWTMGIKGTPGEKLTVEDGFPEETRRLLSSRGHDVIPVPKVAGGMNGVMRDPVTGLFHGGACWRADGTPMGVSGGGAAEKAMEQAPLY
jgi:gamma-glutamyltranspeptidase/glutathione hydrolase